MSFLYTQGIEYDKILLYVTDGAAYMKKSFSLLSPYFANLIYVNCFSHNLHTLCEFTRKQLSNVDYLITNIKKRPKEVARPKIKIQRTLPPFEFAT